MSLNLDDKGPSEDGVWTPVADMMTALMVVFMILVLALSARIPGEIPADEALNLAHGYLQRGFIEMFGPIEEDIGAELDTLNLIVRFYDNETMFPVGSSEIRPNFIARLDGLIPSVVEYAVHDSIWPLLGEIRIEGHTSSEWNTTVSERDAYVLNMELSQGRTRSVLDYFLRHPAVSTHWMFEDIQQRLTANGLSSSHPVRRADGTEDEERSRRVEIRFQQKRDQSVIDLIRSWNTSDNRRGGAGRG